MRPVFETVLPWEPVGVTLIGDPHTFKVASLTERLRDDLQAACDRDDIIGVYGDIDEWIVPSDLRRYSAKHASRVSAYVNARVNELADFYAPYANNIAWMKLGNHETAFIKHHFVDPMAMLIQELNRRRTAEGLIFYGGYTMWWQIKFLHTTGEGKRNGSTSVKFWLHHGAGGNSPVTKGAISRARIQDAIIGADVYAIGHLHTAASIPTTKEYLDDYGNVKRKRVDFLIVPGYSGWEQQAPTEDGYMLDWGSETHYGLEEVGFVRILLEPKMRSGGGLNIKRTIMTESDDVPMEISG